jgi:hypothetical protein
MKLKLIDTAEQKQKGHIKKANPPKKSDTKSAGTHGSQPNGNILVLGDDGLFHVIDRALWQSAPVVDTSDSSYPTLELLASNGVYLADLPDGFGGNIGEICTLINLQAIIAPSGSGAGGAGGSTGP